MARPTYISSLIEPEDVEAVGIMVPPEPGAPPIFFGDVVVKRALVFPDGTMQTSAAQSTGNNIDSGTF